MSSKRAAGFDELLVVVDGFVRGHPGVLDSILLPGVLEKSIIVIVESSVFYFHQVIECPGAVVDIGVLGGGGGNGLPGVGPPVVDGFVRGLPGVLESPGVLVKSSL